MNLGISSSTVSWTESVVDTDADRTLIVRDWRYIGPDRQQPVQLVTPETGRVHRGDRDAQGHCPGHRGGGTGVTHWSSRQARQHPCWPREWIPFATLHLLC